MASKAAAAKTPNAGKSSYIVVWTKISFGKDYHAKGDMVSALNPGTKSTKIIKKMNVVGSAAQSSSVLASFSGSDNVTDMFLPNELHQQALDLSIRQRSLWRITRDLDKTLAAFPEDDNDRAFLKGAHLVTVSYKQFLAEKDGVGFEAA